MITPPPPEDPQTSDPQTASPQIPDPQIPNLGNQPPNRTEPLISTRTALIGTLGILCGVIVGVLTFLAGANVPAATLAGLLVLGGATTFFNKAVG